MEIRKQKTETKNILQSVRIYIIIKMEFCRYKLGGAANIKEGGGYVMERYPKLIVMLTYNDRTVKNAYELFEEGKGSKAEYWGFKEKGIPYEEMRRLYGYMKECGKTTVMEVVAYTESEGMRGAEMAVECGCDFLMGTGFSEKINGFCKAHNLRYLPFVGEVSGRPSVLSGGIESMIDEARSCIRKGAFGVDLLGYRYVGDAATLNRSLVYGVSGEVCIAGSVNSFERLDEIKEASPWAFTIGGAFFEHKFGSDFKEQIDTVCDYMMK